MLFMFFKEWKLFFLSLNNTFLGQMFFIFGNNGSLLSLVEFHDPIKSNIASKLAILWWFNIMNFLYWWQQSLDEQISNEKVKIIDYCLQMFYKTCFWWRLKHFWFNQNVLYICDAVLFFSSRISNWEPWYNPSERKVKK